MPDTAKHVGPSTSLMLDKNGYPVISYFDITKNALKVLHCDDPNCAGSNESITAPHTNAASNTSLTLDSKGFSVISYYRMFDTHLHILHCNDANCDSSEQIAKPKFGGGNTNSEFSSLSLDSNGYPVVRSFARHSNPLGLLHCGSVDCSGSVEVRT